ncbi:MAG: hypothetical protein JSS04_10660 [Proteobacteria bacterium]|nr:hypothetical protein [Pseudomonadota bacterium]
MWDEQEAPGDEAIGRIEYLRKQERVWFSWVCRLHDAHAGTQTPQSAAILSIARRRWAEARRTIERAEAAASHPNDPSSQASD